MTTERRSEFAMAIVVEVGMIMATTRDTSYSMRFLRRHKVRDEVVVRVLAHEGARRDGTARVPNAVPYSKNIGHW